MTAAPPPPDWRPLNTPGLMQLIGPLLSRRDADGRRRYGLATGPQHANPAGLIHGGTLTALLDHAMSLVAWNEAGRQPIVTIHLDTAFVSAARPGDFLMADVTLRHRGGSVLFLDALVTAGGQPETSTGDPVGAGERLVASGSAVMKIVKPSPPEGSR